MILALWAIAAAIVLHAWKAQNMTTAIDDLTAQVDRATTVAQGAVTLIGGLAEQLRANADNPEAIEALANKLEASTDALSTAIAANTVAASEPSPEAPTASAADAGDTQQTA